MCDMYHDFLFVHNYVRNQRANDLQKSLFSYAVHVIFIFLCIYISISTILHICIGMYLHLNSVLKHCIESTCFICVGDSHCYDIEVITILIIIMMIIVTVMFQYTNFSIDSVWLHKQEDGEERKSGFTSIFLLNLYIFSQVFRVAAQALLKMHR